MKYLYQFVKTIKSDNGKVIYDSIEFNEKPRSLSTPTLTAAFETFVATFDSVTLVDNPETKELPIHMVEGQAYLAKVSDIDKKAINELGTSLSAFILEEFAQYLRNADGKVDPFNPQWGPYFSGLIELSELRSFVTQYVLSKNKTHKQGYVFVQRI